jgi:hypothetical protein
METTIVRFEYGMEHAPYNLSRGNYSGLESPVFQEISRAQSNAHAIAQSLLPNTVGQAFDSPGQLFESQVMQVDARAECMCTIPQPCTVFLQFDFRWQLQHESSHGFGDAVQRKEKSAIVERRGLFEGLSGDTKETWKALTYNKRPHPVDPYIGAETFFFQR